MIEMQLERLTLFGNHERRVINFKPGLNVIVGPYGSGKTSLLELLKFALGGRARLSEAVQEGVTAVVLDATIQGRSLTFERDIGELSVSVSSNGQPVATLHSNSSRARGKELASHFLLAAAGLPNMKVQRSTRSAVPAKESISFWDIYRFIYVSQGEMGQSIAGHADTNLNRKRRRSFDLMFGLIDERIAQLEIKDAELSNLLELELKRLSDVTDFLGSTGVPTRGESSELYRQAEERRSTALATLESLRSNTRSASRDLAPDRDAIGALHGRLADVSESISNLRFQVSARRRLVAQVDSDIDALQRTAVAEELLAPIDFRSCPRCLQPVQPERSSASDCYLCVQPLPASVDGADSDEVAMERELDRLRALRSEVVELLAEDESVLRQLEIQLGQASNELQHAEERLSALTGAYVAPMFEDIAQLAAGVASEEAEMRRLNGALAQWEERAAIQSATHRIDGERRQIKDAIIDVNEQFKFRRALVEEFSETFDEIVQELELAWYTSARIDQKDYLPHIGAGEYESLSGGQRTVVSVAYHLAFLTMGLAHPTELRVPTLLIFDTPSKYLGAKDAAQVARNYRRIAAIVDAYDAPVQIIVADNDPPPSSVRNAHTIELSYESPLVPGIEHPGPDAVTPIHDSYEDEDDGLPVASGGTATLFDPQA